MTDIIHFIKESFSNPPIAVIIAETILIFVLFRGWVKHLSKKLNQVLANQVLSAIDRESTDSALDKCLPANGKGYSDHKRTAKDELIKKLADKELIAKKKNFFSL